MTINLGKDLPWSPTTMTLTQRWRFICFRPFISWPMMLSISLRGLSSCEPRWTGTKRKDRTLENNLVKHRPWHKHRHKSPRCSAVPSDVQMSRAAPSERRRRTACREAQRWQFLWAYTGLGVKQTSTLSRFRSMTQTSHCQADAASAGWSKSFSPEESPYKDRQLLRGRIMQCTKTNRTLHIICLTVDWHVCFTYLEHQTWV